MTLSMTTEPGVDILDAFDDHCDLLITGIAFRRQLAKAAERFLVDNPDLGSWMARPVDARLVELSRRPGSWPFVLFALVGGWCRSDLEFLFVKKFGHNAGRSTAILHADDVGALRDAARTMEYSDAQFKMLLGGMIPLVIAGFGMPLGRLQAEDLDGLEAFIQSSPRLTPPTRRCRRSQAFALRQLLFQARFIDSPPPRLREGGPATRAARMVVVGAPEIRRSILAYLETRAVVVRPKTLDKLASALGIFGEYLG